MVLLRRIIGETLRTRRREQRRTLRDVSSSANVSLGYLSEIERGQKEASSELLSSICDALEVPLSDVLGEVTVEVAREEGTLDRLDAEHAPASTLRSVSVLHPMSPPDAVERPVAESGPDLVPPVSLADARAKRARSRDNSPEASVAA